MKFKHIEKLNEFFKNSGKSLHISSYEDLKSKEIYIRDEKDYVISFILKDKDAGVFTIVTASCMGDDFPLHTDIVFITSKDVKYMNSNISRGDKQMQKYEIRSRRIDWFEVNKEKALDYAKKMGENFGFTTKEKKVKHVLRFVRGLSVEEIERSINARI